MAGRVSRPRRRGRPDGQDPVNGTLGHASPGMAGLCSRTWPGARSLSKHWFERRESRCVRYAPQSAGVTDTPAKVQDNSVAQGQFFSDRSVQSIDMLEKFAVADVAPGLHTPCNASVEGPNSC